MIFGRIENDGGQLCFYVIRSCDGETFAGREIYLGSTTPDDQEFRRLQLHRKDGTTTQNLPIWAFGYPDRDHINSEYGRVGTIELDNPYDQLEIELMEPPGARIKFTVVRNPYPILHSNTNITVF